MEFTHALCYNPCRFTPELECIPVGCIPPAHWPHLVVSEGCAQGACMPGRHLCPRGHACVGSMHAQGACVDRIPDTRLWKHYLPATTVVGGNYDSKTNMVSFFCIATFMWNNNKHIKIWFMLVQDIQSINICTEELIIFSFLFLLYKMKYFIPLKKMR